MNISFLNSSVKTASLTQNGASNPATSVSISNLAWFNTPGSEVALLPRAEFGNSSRPAPGLGTFLGGTEERGVVQLAQWDPNESLANRMEQERREDAHRQAQRQSRDANNRVAETYRRDGDSSSAYERALRDSANRNAEAFRRELDRNEPF